MADEPRLVVACLGDSITAGNPGWDPNPVRRQIEDPGDDERSQYLYWAAARHPHLELRNFGVGGERTDQIAARFDEASAGASVLLVQGGINDIVQGRPSDDAAADLRAIVRRAAARGLAVLLADVLPWNNGWPQADPQLRSLNKAIASIGRDERVPVLPFYATLEDPDRPGRMRSDWTADGNHPSVEGHRRLGQLAFQLPPGWQPRGVC